MAFYTQITGSSQAAIGTVICIAAKNGTFTISDYPGYLLCDGTQYYVAQYPSLAKVLGAYYDNSGTAATSSSAQMINWTGSSNTSMGTFKVPDYRGKKLVGCGGVTGVGSIAAPVTLSRFNVTGGTADEVGSMGGKWVMNETRQGAEYAVGSVTISGYTSVSGTLNCVMSGATSYRIGPLDTGSLSKAPGHNHFLLTSQPDPNGVGEGSVGDPDADSGPYAGETLTNNDGYIYAWDPGEFKGHTHKISELNFNANRPKSATYDYSSTSTSLVNIGEEGSGNAYYNDSAGTSGYSTLSGTTVSEYIDKYVSASDSGVTISDGTFTLTAATPLSMVATLVPQSDIPLLMPYLRVNYLIKAY